MAELSDEDITRMARARVSFRVHLVVYLLVNAFLVGIWYFTSDWAGVSMNGSDDSFWPIWPILGWGLGVAIHGFTAYGAGSDWQSREEEKIRAKLKR